MNYKTKLPSFTFQGYEVSIPANAIPMCLYDQVDNASGADGMIDFETNGVYVVPTGKTFRMLGVILWSSVSASVGDALTISQGDTENAETLSKLVIKLNLLDSQKTVYPVTHLETFSTGKYITYKPNTTNVEMIMILGYEF